MRPRKKYWQASEGAKIKRKRSSYYFLDLGGAVLRTDGVFLLADDFEPAALAFDATDVILDAAGANAFACADDAA